MDSTRQGENDHNLDKMRMTITQVILNLGSTKKIYGVCECVWGKKKSILSMFSKIEDLFPMLK